VTAMKTQDSRLKTRDTEATTSPISSRRKAYSSLIQLPTETPPQLMPCTRLPARDSLRGRPSAFLFGLFMEMGTAPPKESCLPLPMPGSKVVPLIMAEVLESGSRKLGFFWPWDEGDDDAFLVGVAMSIGEVIGIVKRSLSGISLLGVGGCCEKGELASESSSIKVPSN
jgi:hypothetical protein